MTNGMTLADILHLGAKMQINEIPESAYKIYTYILAAHPEMEPLQKGMVESMFIRAYQNYLLTHEHRTNNNTATSVE